MKGITQHEFCANLITGSIMHNDSDKSSKLLMGVKYFIHNIQILASQHIVCVYGGHPKS